MLNIISSRAMESGDYAEMQILSEPRAPSGSSRRRRDAAAEAVFADHSRVVSAEQQVSVENGNTSTLSDFFHLSRKRMEPRGGRFGAPSFPAEWKGDAWERDVTILASLSGPSCGLLRVSSEKKNTTAKGQNRPSFTASPGYISANKRSHAT